MRSFYKICITIILLANIIIIFIYEYNNYFIKSFNGKINITPIDKTKINSFSILYDYNENMQNHLIKDINKIDYSISSDSNYYKYIDIINIKKSNEIDNNILFTIIKRIQVFNNDNIKFILLIPDTLNYKDRKYLEMIQYKYNIIIGELDSITLSDIYRNPNKRCWYSILLDNNNKVRYSNYAISMELMNEIIIKELKKYE